MKHLRRFRVVSRRLVTSLATLLIIAYLTLFGLAMAERGREGLPAEPLSAASEALWRTFTYITDHPATYYWDKYEIPAFRLVATTFGRSAGLLLVSLGVATALGVPLGIAVALARRKGGASLVLLLSVLGVSTPSFLLAMLLWVVNIQVHRRFDVPALPPTGFGWDFHLVMPVLVLAARPLAQIAQVTYISLSEILGEDYIRTARAKGLHWRAVRDQHALPNVLIPILTTLGTSLRFSLASLPVVEYFFIWPGVGLMLLEAIELGMTPLVVDLILSLGTLFLLLNTVLEVLYPRLDPRLRNGDQEEARQERRGWREWLKETRFFLKNLVSQMRTQNKRPKLRPLPVDVEHTSTTENDAPVAARRSRWVLDSALRNPALLLGAVLALGFLGLALFGGQLTLANPYEIHGVMTIEGEIAAPPFYPSTVFPWGTDHLGRDVQALVLAGARQTLALAVLGTVARVLVGAILGMLAGWWQSSWLDRLVTGAVGVWAAFPYTLFAMIVIQALGIQQGVWVFVVALCVVGWGEVAQFVRGQVLGIKPRLYIEAARAVGAQSVQILTRHVLPNLLTALLVLAVLEMGGVLMLLSELGFLNIFVGGGFRVQIAEVGAMVPLIAYFSDVPEWGALLANIRDWWRSYPWMAWYPGVAFFLAIVAFNVWGEGLRRFLTEGRINLSRMFNKYTALAAGVAALGLVWVLRSMSPLGVYRPQARLFDVGRTLDHIQTLASPAFQGRETGTSGAELAAQYIAAQMKEIGLAPGGKDDTYIQTVPRAVYQVGQVPRLEILDDEGRTIEALVYREDFILQAGPSPTFGAGEGAIVGLTTGPLPDAPVEAPPSGQGTWVVSPGQELRGGDLYGLRNLDLYDKVILVREAELGRINVGAALGALVVSDNPLRFQRKFLYGYAFDSWPPVMYVSPEVAERLLATAGSSLDELAALSANLQPGEVALTDPGATVRVETVVESPTTFDEVLEADYDMHATVVGFIPGTGAQVEVAPGARLSNQAILVSAYYDGVGMDFDGTLYPGANDNASGVATMLEMARVLKEAPYPPKRTVVFVAWPDAERYDGLSVSNVTGVKAALRSLAIEAVIELSGVGAGSGQEIVLGQGTSYRLVQLFQRAAGRVGAATTTRGRGPHYGLPSSMGFGGRAMLTAYVSWDGSDQTAHTPEDTFEAIDPEKLEQAGQTTLLALTVLSRELEY